MNAECQNCKWFATKTVPYIGKDGRCYRFPPQHKLEGGAHSEVRITGSEHVSVDNDDWCGEFESKV